MTPPPNKDIIVGKFFHQTDEYGKILFQGKVIQKQTIDSNLYYLLQYFSWIDGATSYKKVLNIENMYNFNFYDDENDWKETGLDSLK